MILLDGFEAGRSRVLEVILNEFQMNCRHDALGTRLWCSGFHNKLDSFGVIKRRERTESENNRWRILSGGGPDSVLIAEPCFRSSPRPFFNADHRRGVCIESVLNSDVSDCASL